VPLGNVDVDRLNGAGLIVIVSFELAVCAGLPESVTVTVTVELPAVVGVPVMVQPFRIKPSGSVPVIEQLYGEVPPVAVIVAV